MMRYAETCPCGSRFEVECTGWGVRTLDIAAPLDEWRSLHRHHIDRAHAPRRSGPTQVQLSRLYASATAGTTREDRP